MNWYIIWYTNYYFGWISASFGHISSVSMETFYLADEIIIIHWLPLTLIANPLSSLLLNIVCLFDIGRKWITMVSDDYVTSFHCVFVVIQNALLMRYCGNHHWNAISWEYALHNSSDGWDGYMHGLLKQSFIISDKL